MRLILKLSALLLATATLCSCASVSLVDSWRNPAIHPDRLQKLLVVSITKKDSSRTIYEDIFANELSRHGVAAVAGYTLIPGGEKAAWSVLEWAVKQASAQAVLTVQTIKVEPQTTVQPGHASNNPSNWHPGSFPTGDLYGYYGSMANYGPSYITTYDIATMQVNLFDAISGKIIWAATFKSSEPENVTTVGKDLARKVVDTLAKEGFI